MSEIDSIGVIGAGTMGAGIAQVAGMAGIAVVLIDTDASALPRAIKRIHTDLDKGVEKQKVTPEIAELAKAKITTSANLNDVGGRPFVVEAIFENGDAKKTLYGKLGSLLGPEAILASNTSSISISELGAASGRHGRFIGMHFFNPVPRMKLGRGGQRRADRGGHDRRDGRPGGAHGQDAGPCEGLARLRRQPPAHADD